MPLRPATVKKLHQLNAKIAHVSFDAVARRDPKTGTFTSRSTVHPDALRTSWSRRAPEPAPEEKTDGTLFKRSLLAALRGR